MPGLPDADSPEIDGHHVKLSVALAGLRQAAPGTCQARELQNFTGHPKRATAAYGPGNDNGRTSVGIPKAKQTPQVS